jgi:molecular chaperone GrpE
MEEIRRGYKIREKLLRPAMVKIAVNPAQVSD